MSQLTNLQAIILGIVEGLTEYLPVSSTGHLIIVSALLGLDAPPERKAAVDAFNIVIQGGAILAVLGLYRERVWGMVRGLLGQHQTGLRLFMNIVVAFLPAAVFGVLLDEAIEQQLFYPTPVVIALVAGGVLMIGIGPWQRRSIQATATPAAVAMDDESAGEPVVGNTTATDPAPAGVIDLEDLSWQRALIIGLLQCVAMWPGTSRSMMTIVGGMVVGLRPKQAAEFSFLLGLPTLGGACVYRILKDVLSDGPSMLTTLGIAPMLVGIATATVSAAIAVKWFVAYLSRHDFAVFGWYRVALGIAVQLLVWFEVLNISP